MQKENKLFGDDQETTSTLKRRRQLEEEEEKNSSCEEEEEEEEEEEPKKKKKKIRRPRTKQQLRSHRNSERIKRQMEQERREKIAEEALPWVSDQFTEKEKTKCLQGHRLLTYEANIRFINLFQQKCQENAKLLRLDGSTQTLFAQLRTIRSFLQSYDSGTSIARKTTTNASLRILNGGLGATGEKEIVDAWKETTNKLVETHCVQTKWAIGMELPDAEIYSFPWNVPAATV